MTWFVTLLSAAALGLVFWTALGLPASPPRLSRRDRWRCFSELPEFFELLALGLSTGSSLLAAWSATVGATPGGPLHTELERARRALDSGRSPNEVMAALSARLGEERCVMALSLIAQAMVRGNALEAVLLSQAASLRRLRMLEVERRAQTAPLRMMAPVFAFIFPAVLMLLLAPVLLKLAQGNALF